MSIESSGEFQSIVLSSIMKDAYLYTRTSRYITNEFFTKYNYRVIYNAIKYYYDKYSNLPTKNEALSVISEINNAEVVPTSEVKSEFITLYDTPKYNEDFVIDKITTFIKRNNVENVLKTYLPKISKGESIAVDTIGSDLAKGLSFTLSKANSFRLSDTEEIGEVRKNAIGTEDNPLVIPSFLSGINKSLQFHGYKPGDLIMICSPPGCLTGDTKIKLTDGAISTIEDLYNNKVSPKIYGYNLDTNKVDVGVSDYVKLTRYANDLVKVTIDDKYDIKCTPDHLFLLRSGEYKRADELRPNELLMSLHDEYMPYYNHRVTSVGRIYLDESVPVYDLVNSSVSNNYAVALDDSGIFVHNCGKTMFMVNEGANASVLGFTVLHLFIGDMKEYDGFIRYTSRITEIPQDDIVAMPVSDQRNLVDKYNLQGYFNNIVVSSYAAGEISIDEMIQEVNRLQNEYQMHFDMILVDYADNLIPDSDMMYESGGNIYNKLSLLGYRNKSVIIVGSQPKPAYWDTEIIPKSAAADSSRKQHVIDVMITMGRAGKGATIGSIHLPKVRRGREGGIIRYKSSFERAYLEAISDQEYLNLKGELIDL